MASSSYTSADPKTMTREGNLSLAECVAFYLEVYERPTFLQRNLRKVLASHRQKFSASRQARRKLNMELNGNTKSEEKDAMRRFWNPKEIINILETQVFSDNDPILRIDITDIRDRIARFRNSDQAMEMAESLSTLDPIPAACSLTIWDSSTQTKVEETRACTIIPHRKADNQRFASVKLSSPFLVPLKRLHSEPNKSLTRDLTYSTQFTITTLVQNPGVWPPVDMQLPVPKNPRIHDGAEGAFFFKAPLLVAKWTRLPYLPEKEEDALMELKARQDDRTYKPKLSLKLNAEWINADSPLAKYNKERVTSAADPQVPAIKNTQEDTIVQTEWIFEDVIDYMSSITVSGYTCQLCNYRRFTEPAEYHFHLLRNHDMFEFEYSLTVEENQNRQSVSSGVVRVKLVQDYHSRIKRPPEAISWQRPKDPFHLEEFLKGNHDWIKSEPQMTRTASLPKSDTQSTMSMEPNRVEGKKKRKRAIEDIPAFIITRKRRFKVPRAPKGISFYRTFSKVPLIEGEELSESDDDINEEWLLEKHADTIDSFTDTLPTEKHFMRKFDRHMLLEDTCSDLHAEDALVRFCKQNTAWLRGKDMKFEFAKKVASLALNHQVSNDILVACWRIINDTNIPAELKDDRAETHKSNSRVFDKSERLMENDHLYARCAKCSRGIYDLRDLLACANGQCPNKTFHLRCCDWSPEPTRPKDWICPSCAHNGFKIPKRPSTNSRLAKSASSDTATKVPHSKVGTNKLPNGANGIIPSTQVSEKTRPGSRGSVASAAVLATAPKTTPTPAPASVRKFAQKAVSSSQASPKASNTTKSKAVGQSSDRPIVVDMEEDDDDDDDDDESNEKEESEWTDSDSDSASTRTRTRPRIVTIS